MEMTIAYLKEKAKIIMNSNPIYEMFRIGPKKRGGFPRPVICRFLDWEVLRRIPEATNQIERFKRILQRGSPSSPGTRKKRNAASM